MYECIYNNVYHKYHSDFSSIKFEAFFVVVVVLMRLTTQNIGKKDIEMLISSVRSFSVHIFVDDINILAA